MRIILVTGPARSGKSEWAEMLAMHSQKAVIYVATAKVDSTDAQWQSRIKKHRDRRPQNWRTWEIPDRLVDSINTAPQSSCILVDSLGTWVANRLEEDDSTWENSVQNLCSSLTTDAPSQQGGVALTAANIEIIFVAEETGWGVVPASASGRIFRDRLGNLVRRIGEIADTVYLITGGYALNLTALGSRLPSLHE